MSLSEQCGLWDVPLKFHRITHPYVHNAALCSILCREHQTLRQLENQAPEALILPAPRKVQFLRNVRLQLKKAVWAAGATLMGSVLASPQTLCLTPSECCSSPASATAMASWWKKRMLWTSWTGKLNRAMLKCPSVLPELFFRTSRECGSVSVSVCANPPEEPVQTQSLLWGRLARLELLACKEHFTG